MPSISLLVIDYNLLLEKDITEISKLIEASKELGFFYLKLNDQLNPDPMFTLAEKIFELPLDAKLEYAMDGKNGAYFGYKAVGCMYNDRKGTPDTIEFGTFQRMKFSYKTGPNFPKPFSTRKIP